MSRILERVEADPNGGCWLWSGALCKDGYGVAYDPVAKKKISAHRLSFREHFGKLTKGLVLDHKCRVRACVNPLHLREVTSGQNVLCGEGPTALNLRKTHCPQGHPYEGENLVRLRGWRQCRVCKAAENDRFKAKLKSERHARGLMREPRGKYR